MATRLEPSLFCKRMFLRKSTLLAAISLTAVALANAGTTVDVDPGAPWIGFMNVFNLPADGGAYQFGNAWGTADLRASFGPTGLTLSPCTNVWETTDTYWVKADKVSPNKNMDANMYVQNDALAGQTLTFNGLTLANSLVSPYTSVAFIKDFVPNYSSSTSVTVPLVGGNPFSLTLATTAGDHIQYGFETIGPDANPSTAASLGFAQIQVVPEPSCLALLGGATGLWLLRRRQ